MQNIHIMEAREEDSLGTMEVQYKAWLQTYPNENVGVTTQDIEERYKDKFTEVGLEKRRKLIVNQQVGEKFFVAKKGNEVVGICVGEVQDNKNQLLALYILPKYQGQGIGTKLWEAVYSFFDQNKDIYVEVVDYNVKAITFYKKLGFIDTGKRFQEERFRMKSGALFTEMEMVRKINS